jgi:Flp pilus assembly protein TadG
MVDSAHGKSAPSHAETLQERRGFIRGLNRRKVHHFSRDAGGMVAVEFGMIAMPFFGIVLALFQVGIVFLAQQELETAVQQASRLVLTGQAQNQSLTQSQFATQVCNNLPALFNCGNIMVDMQVANSFTTANTAAPTLTYNGQGKVTNNWQYQTGAPGSVVVLRIMYQWPTFLVPLFKLSNLANGSRLLMATAVFQNEPY